MNSLIFALLKHDIHFAFNPHYVGSQLYYNYVSAEEFPVFWLGQVPTTPHKPYNPLLRRIARKIFRIGRDLLLLWRPDLAKRFPILLRGRGPAQANHPSASVAHHSCFKQMLSFFPSDSLWGLPMAETKKTLFLYDITFFEILRMIASPINCESSPFIVQHIIDVNRAILESHSLMVPTKYLAEQLPLHFPAARTRPIDVIPLASTITDENEPLHFEPMKKVGKKNSVLIVCGFDGFKNDNKGMGAILDIICLHQKLFKDEKSLQFTLVTPKYPELIQRIEELGMADCITIMPGLSVPQLIREYRQAKFLWVHSIDEGFCLPILEASLLEIPVLVSDVPSLREIWGDAVDYIDVFNRYEAVNRLHEYNTGHSMANPGANFIRAQSYTIERTVKEIWSALEKVA